jgi:hypothetical protein
VLGSLSPTGGKNAREFGFLKARREDRRARHRVHRVNESNAAFAACQFYAYNHGGFRQWSAARIPIVSGK